LYEKIDFVYPSGERVVKANLMFCFVCGWFFVFMYDDIIANLVGEIPNN
jgi:hypothetical protein